MFMLARALNSNGSEAEIFARIQAEIIQRYSVDQRLASEMAWDLMEVLSVIESDYDIFDKYFLQ
jgi:hypothetical protein